MKKRRWMLWMTALLAAAVLMVIALDQRLIVRRYTVEAEEITTPVRLAVVTDFHGCDYGPGAQRLLAAIAAEEPDLVLLVGDIYDDEMPWDASDTLVTALATRWPTFYVTGNHEYWSEEIDEICRRVSAAGATVLDMDCRTVEVNGQHLNICGVPDPYAMVYSGAPETQKQLACAMSLAEPGAFVLLLAHRPELIEYYAAAGFDLVVSGHAHGGQVRIPGLLNGLYAPNQGWFPEYVGGVYHVEDTTLIVSRGLARESTRLPRIFNRPELVIITLE